MSDQLRDSIKWDSSSEEDDVSEVKYGLRLRDPLKHTQDSVMLENDVVPSRRRGRGPSKRPCLNRNALMARENRQRKKAYLEKIENKLSYYEQENKNLVNTIVKQGSDIKRLTSEVAYLKSILNNNTNIASLLKTINDGLRKISTRKKCTVQPTNGYPQSPDNLQVRMRNQHLKDSKGNRCVSQTDMATLDNTNHDFMEQNGASQSDDKGIFSNIKKRLDSKNKASKPVQLSDVDSNCTLNNVSRCPTVNVKNDMEGIEVDNVVTTTTASSYSQGSENSCTENSYTENIKDLDGFLPSTEMDLSSTHEKKQMDMLNADFDQFPSFNMDIFEDIPKCDYGMDSVENLHDAPDLFNGEDMFPSLDNTGICLHVNSDTVSLEYCSVCHNNSKNTELA